MVDAITRVYGVEFDHGEEPVRAVGPHGKTDRQIVREVLAARGVDGRAIDAGFEEFERTCCELHHAIERPMLTGDAQRRTAGVLESLAGAGHALALLTGNLEPIARRKMELAGLGDFFAAHQGAFGSDAEARPDLVPIARRRAGSSNGRPHPAGDTVVIGDTPLDVAAAHADGAYAIGITGRRFSRADLLDSGADAVVDELDEVASALDRLRP